MPKKAASFNFGFNAKTRKSSKGKGGKKKSGKGRSGSKSNAWRAYVGSNAPIPD